MKRPAFQFYPADWRKDMALQSCSVAARGLWIDMLCIAHECEPYGHLTVNGKPMSAAQIGRHTGLTEREATRLITELEDAGVLSRTEDGVIHSRRMVRDEDIRNRRAAGGQAGSAHGIKGAEHGSKGGRPPKERGDKKPPLEPPPSSSSSTSVGSGSTDVDPLPVGASPYAAVCIALKAAGVANVNPAHPTLRALVDAGADVLEFVGAVKASEGKADRFAYVIGTVEGQRKRAAETAGLIHHGPLKVISKQAALEERNRSVAQAWAKGHA